MNEETSIWSARLAEFRDATASAAPTPGGGSVAAVSAGLGLGLVIMALEISLQRKDAASPEAMQALIAAGRDELARITEDADADVRSFRGYMAALKLPKSTEDERTARGLALQHAVRQATESPLQAARHMHEALRLAWQALPLAHAHVVSDVGAGARLLEGALQAVLLNVDINLPSLKDAAFRSLAEEERRALAAEGAAVAAEIAKGVGERLGGG